jgi:hypothetical protein
MAEGFKKMTKMYTDEPSVVLNLKKGGKVASKMAKGGKPMKKAMGGESLMSALAGAKPMVGGSSPMMAPSAPKKPSMSARKRAMMADRMMATPMKKGGHADAAEDRAMIKKAMSGKKFAKGGVVTSMMTKTTVPDSVATPYATTAVRSTPNGKTNGTTGAVKMSNAGGYKNGGKVGNRVSSETNMRPDTGKMLNGGTISGNAKDYLETQVHTASKNTSKGGTGDVKMGNGAGYATGGVANSNSGGYKKGGSSKKAYATGGIVDSGKPVALKQGNVHSGPKTNINFSGVYKDGGKVTGNTIPNKRLVAISNSENANVMKNARLDDNLQYPKTSEGKQKTPKFR